MGQARRVPAGARDTPGRRPRTARDTGAAALEFALVSPLLFTLLFMIFSAGWGMWEYQAARATAREAARLAAVGIPLDTSLFRRGIACLGEGNGLHSGALTGIEVHFHTDATLQGLTDSMGVVPGSYVTVTLTYTSALRGVLPSPFTDDDGTFTTEAVSRVEQVGLSDLQADPPLIAVGPESCP